mmetsp:Transcript_71289/g.157689  ORF Transcript_71289/g.157689 Transcript_71289/m.157689 type:complete len:237 (-) Transcript_71289:163-873(-)
MLGKSFKMLPVMVWSILISGKQYKSKDWAIATAVTWGVTQFLLTGEIQAGKHQDKGSSLYGLLLMGGFLACDGFTSTFQEKLFAQHKTSKFNQMLYTNAGSSCISIVSLVLSGSLTKALSFSSDHPSFLPHAACLSMAAVAGQFFIMSQVKEFGALVLAATMNIRQVLSILISYIMYAHTINWQQFLGLALVFGALFYKSFAGLVSGEKRSAHVGKATLEMPKVLEEGDRPPEPRG